LEIAGQERMEGLLEECKRRVRSWVKTGWKAKEGVPQGLEVWKDVSCLYSLPFAVEMLNRISRTGFLKIRLGYSTTSTRSPLSRSTPSRQARHQSSFSRSRTARIRSRLETLTENLDVVVTVGE
jgi:hypothetical protein